MENNIAFLKEQQAYKAFDALFERIKQWGATPFDGIEHILEAETTTSAGNTPEGAIDSIIYDDTPTQGRFYLKRVENNRTTYYSAWKHDSMDLFQDPSNSGLTYQDRLYVAPSTYIICGKVFTLDTQDIEAQLEDLFAILNGDSEGSTQQAKDGLIKRMASAESTIGTHTTDISGIKTSLGDHATEIGNIKTDLGNKASKTDLDTLEALVNQVGATYFDGYIDMNLSTLEDIYTASSLTDSIYYNTRDGKFYLYRGGQYFKNWDRVLEYNSVVGSTARIDKFFVSPNGYVIRGQKFEIDTLRMLQFDGVIKEQLSRTPSGNAQLAVVGDKIKYYVPWGTFILERTSGDGSKNYYAKWYSSDKYDYTTTESAYLARTDTFFVSPEGYVVNGILNSVDLQPVWDALTLKADEATVALRLAQKLNITDFQTARQALLDIIATKANTTTVDQLTQVVAGKANQTDMSVVQYGLTQRVEKSVFNDAMDTWAAAYADLDARIAQNLKREIVNALPTNPDEHTIYMVKVDSEGDDFYVEYMWDTTHNRYERIGSTKVDLTGVTTDKDLNRYVAANNGIQIVVTANNNPLPITLKAGDKWKVEYMGGDTTVKATYSYDIVDGAQPLANNLTFGQEYTLGANENHQNILIKTKGTSTDPLVVRFFLVDNDLGYNFVTDADIDAYFANLDNTWRRTIN